MTQNNNRQFELIIKDGDPKLTVTPTRITVKLPFSVTDTDKYTQWSKLVADQIPLDTPSLRGRFVEDSITLRKDNKEVYKTFNFESVYEKYQTIGGLIIGDVLLGYKLVNCTTPT